MTHYGRVFDKIGPSTAKDQDTEEVFEILPLTQVAPFQVPGQDPVQNPGEPPQNDPQGQSQAKTGMSFSAMVAANLASQEAPEDNSTWMRCQNCGEREKLSVLTPFPEGEERVFCCASCKEKWIHASDWNTTQRRKRAKAQFIMVQMLSTVPFIAMEVDPSEIWERADQILAYRFGKILEEEADESEIPTMDPAMGGQPTDQDQN